MTAITHLYQQTADDDSLASYLIDDLADIEGALARWAAAHPADRAQVIERDLVDELGHSWGGLGASAYLRIARIAAQMICHPYAQEAS